MKKIISVLLAMILVFSAIPLGGLFEYIKGTDLSFLAPEASAVLEKAKEYEPYIVNGQTDSAEQHRFLAVNTVESDLWSYSVNNGVAVIKSYNGTAASVTVPTSATIDGMNYKIRSIGEYAFSGNQRLAEVVIPQEITSVGKGAFQNCTNLEKITINGNIGDCNDAKYHNEGVFYNTGTNTDGMTVTFGSAVTRIPSNIFRTHDSNYYAHVKTVVLSNKITEIGSYAFAGCYDLDSVNFTDAAGLLTIGSCAFENDIKLTSIVFPSALTTVNEFAFNGCESLKSITLPKSTTSLGKGAFSNCTNLETITINGNIGDCNDAYLYHYQGVFYNTGTNTDGMTVTFGSTVTRIPSNIFRTHEDRYSNYYAHVKNVIIPSSVQTVGSCAFDNCYDLKTFSIKSTKAQYESESIECTPSQLTFECYYGSTSEAFAKNNGYKIVYLAPETPVLSKVSNDKTGVKITWKGAAGAENYIVYRKSGSSSFKSIKTVSGKTTSYVDTTAKSGTKYTYTVQATNASGKSGYDKTGLSKLYLATPTVKTSNTSKGVSVKWNKITGAKGYYVYRKAGSGSWTKIKTISSGSTVSYTDTKVKSGTKYSYYVKAYNGKTTSSYKASTTLMFLKAVKLSSASSGKTGITVKWGKVTSAKGYYVYRKTGSGSYKKLATVKSGSTVKYLDKSAKKGKTYTYYVKAYNGSYTGSYANTLKCKDKY